MFQSQNKVQRTKTFLNSKPCDRGLVFFRVGIRKHPGLEFVELPNFQVGQVTHNSDVANDFSAFSQQRMNQHSALAVNVACWP